MKQDIVCWRVEEREGENKKDWKGGEFSGTEDKRGMIFMGARGRWGEGWLGARRPRKTDALYPPLSIKRLKMYF